MTDAQNKTVTEAEFLADPGKVLRDAHGGCVEIVEGGVVVASICRPVRLDPPEGYEEPFQIPMDQPHDPDDWFMWPDSFRTRDEAVAAQHAHAKGQRLIGAMQEREEAAIHTAAFPTDDSASRCPKCGGGEWTRFGPEYSMRCCYTCRHEWTATTARENSQSCTCDHLPAGALHAEGCPMSRKQVDNA